MKRAKKATVRERLADLLELPGDLAYNGCIITLIGEREILLENYRSILEYRSDHLLVLTGNGRYAFRVLPCVSFIIQNSR